MIVLHLFQLLQIAKRGLANSPKKFINKITCCDLSNTVTITSSSSATNPTVSEYHPSSGEVKEDIEEYAMFNYNEKL